MSRASRMVLTFYMSRLDAGRQYRNFIGRIDKDAYNTHDGCGEALATDRHPDHSHAQDITEARNTVYAYYEVDIKDAVEVQKRDQSEVDELSSSSSCPTFMSATSSLASFSTSISTSSSSSSDGLPSRPPSGTGWSFDGDWDIGVADNVSTSASFNWRRVEEPAYAQTEAKTRKQTREIDESPVIHVILSFIYIFLTIFIGSHRSVYRPAASYGLRRRFQPLAGWHTKLGIRRDPEVGLH